MREFGFHVNFQKMQTYQSHQVKNVVALARNICCIVMRQKRVNERFCRWRSRRGGTRVILQLLGCQSLSRCHGCLLRLFFRRQLFLLIDAYGQFRIVYTIIGLEVAGVPVLGCYQRAATAIRSGKESYWRRLVHSVRWLRCLLFDSFFDEPCWSLPRGRASLLSANLSWRVLHLGEAQHYTTHSEWMSWGR